MAIIWDVGLPQYVNQTGYKEQRQLGKIESKMDSGPKQMRNLYTAVPVRFTFNLTLTDSQVTLLDEFYYSTCKNGTETFTWMHPRTYATVDMRFIGNPPAISAISDRMFKATFTVEILP